MMAHEPRADAEERAGPSDGGGGVQATAVEGAALPWGYGRDRVTAIVRDPDSAWVYWEITDPAIEAARRRLGGPADASCNLRVYDTTGRLFDGGNANEYFDVGVQRTDREYFLSVQRPGRTVHVEIGLRSHEGRFQPIARSGAFVFPRKEPSPNLALEWTTVVTDHTHPSARPYASRYRASTPAPIDAWQASASAPDGQGRIVSEQSELIGMFPEAARLHRSDPAAFARWAGLLLEGAAELLERFEWQAGPFPVELRGAFGVEIHFTGGGPPVLVERRGVRFLTQGPWNVTLRGANPTSGGRVLGTWSIRWSIASSPLIERWGRFLERSRTGVFTRKRTGAGGSERLGAFELGGSERWRLGASERLRMGASERQLSGASELIFAGATELALAGASEQRWAGASERWLGASERRWAGASELRLAGASEQRLAGASELRLEGASERGLLGASEQRPGGAGEAGGRDPWRKDT